MIVKMSCIRFLHLWIFLLAAIFSPLNAFAEAPENVPDSPIAVNADVDKPLATLGDVINFTLTLLYNPEIEPVTPDFSRYLEDFELIDSRLGEPHKKGGKIELVHRYKLRADKIGSFKIPSVPITFTLPNPEKPDAINEGQVLTPETLVEVKSILRLQGEPTDIRDIKPQVELEDDWRKFYYFAFIFFILAGLAIMLYSMRKKRIKTPPAAQAIALLPHERAISELHALLAKRFIERKMFSQHYFELSEIFRRYLECRYNFPALDWTTEEISLQLRQMAGISPVTVKSALSILKETDEVKFAKVIPTENASSSIMTSILNFVQTTQIIAAPNRPTTDPQP